MNQEIYWLMLIVLVSVSGCTTTIPKDPTILLASSDRQFEQEYEFEKGKRYVLEVQSRDHSKVTYKGKISEVNENSVVLEDAEVRAEVERGLPVPLIGRMFKNKSIGVSRLDDQITIAKEQIVQFQSIVDEKTSISF